MGGLIFSCFMALVSGTTAGLFVYAGKPVYLGAAVVTGLMSIIVAVTEAAEYSGKNKD